MHYPLPSDKRAHFYFKWPEHPDSIYTVKIYLQNSHAQVGLQRTYMQLTYHAHTKPADIMDNLKEHLIWR